jgi:hypothetical protein
VVKFAHEEGFFKKNGLDVTLIYVNSGVLASQVVASGTAGAAAITATDALRVMSAGVPMKIIMVNIDQFQHLFVARPGIKNPGGYEGEKSRGQPLWILLGYPDAFPHPPPVH